MLKRCLWCKAVENLVHKSIEIGKVLQDYPANTRFYHALLFLRGIQSSDVAEKSSSWLGPLPNNPGGKKAANLKLQWEACCGVLQICLNFTTSQLHVQHSSKLHRSFSLWSLPQNWWFLWGVMTLPLVCIRILDTRKNVSLTAWAGFCFTWSKSSL